MQRKKSETHAEHHRGAWDDELTDAQQEAVQHRDGPLLVIAGPGSGKTRVVTYRAATLLASGVLPHQILALTFTNKAADEMKRRLRQLVPGAAVWMGTFHRFCAQLLRHYGPFVGLRENFTIFDTDDSTRACKRAMEDQDHLSFGWTPGQLLHAMSGLKASLVTAAQFQPRPGNPQDAVLAKVYPAYQQILLQCNAVDFDDLLLHVATLMRENDELRAKLDDYYRYVMVDEYQDTNLTQYAIVRGLCVDFPNLAATGDPDQSIYGWRGANVKNILEFEKDYPHTKVVRLEQNYRSTPNILRVADALISRNHYRKPKSLFTENAEGIPVRIGMMADHQAEASAIATRIADSMQEGYSASDFAIFYRVSYLSRTIETSLRRRGIPYQIVRGVEFYQRKEIRDVIAYLQLINNDYNDSALTRILNVPARGLGRVTEKKLLSFAQRERTSMFAAMCSPDFHGQLSTRAAQSVKKFSQWIRSLQSEQSGSVAALVQRIIDESGYLPQLKQSASEEDQQRAENLEELVTDASEFDAMDEQGGLDGFLEKAALVNDVDRWDASAERVTLMTLHAAKGLEFPCVFIVGIEHGLLPHARCMDKPMELEEERRLLFVGITRAQRELQLSCAMRRPARGVIKATSSSQFLLELPTDEMEVYEESRYQSQTLAQPSGDSQASDDDESFTADPDSPDGADVFVPVVPFPRPSSPRSGKPSKRRKPPAIECTLVDADTLPKTPGDLCVGGTVLHPDYGPGKVVGLTGQSPRRTATVRFAATGVEKKFIVEMSPLRPAPKSGPSGPVS